MTANPIIDSLQKAISDLVNTCKGLVVVCVNRDVAFHGGRGDLGTIANKVSEICKAAGALVTENDRLWRVVHALTGKNYKIPGSSNLQHFLLKRLLIEKSIDAVAPSNAFVCELEGTCINEPDLRFNIPKNMEESKVKFEYKPTFTAQSKRKQEQQDEGHGEQDAFGKADVGDPRLRWYTVTELSTFICELCARELQVSKSKVLGPNSKFNPTSCVNCCANWNADTNGIARSIEGKKMYTRLFAECVVAIPDLQSLMVDVNNIQAMITIIRELAYSKLKKELSHAGFVSMTVDQAAQFYNNGHGKQLCALRDVIVCKNSEGVEERMSIFLIDKDLGNVAYSSWIKSVLDQGTMYELLGQTSNEESLGDVVEMVLGFFEVMSYFQHELPLWKDAWKIFLVLAAAQITGERSQEALPAALGMEYLAAAGRGLPTAAATVRSANGLSSEGSPGLNLVLPSSMRVSPTAYFMSVAVWYPHLVRMMMTVESLSAGVSSKLLKS